jgi:lysophospholipase L1-like esterase
MKAPDQTSGSAESAVEERRHIGRALNDILSRAKENSLLETVKDKGIDVKWRRKGGGGDDAASNSNNNYVQKITRILSMGQENPHEMRLMTEIGSVLLGSQEKVKESHKKIKLLFIGDSLSACVGVDKVTDGPVLQQTIAHHLQSITGSDVEWHNSSVIGGTVSEIRDKLEEGKVPFLRNVKHDEELVVVLICGLNDYKKFLFSLWNPLKAMQIGPMTFKAEILTLLREIQMNCKSDNTALFLPATPVRFMASDPKWLFSVFPLNIMGWSLNSLWDTQKRILSDEQQAEGVVYEKVDQARAMRCKNTFYIDEPDLEEKEALSPSSASASAPASASASASASATSDTSTDVVASDGVHLSSYGYKVWGKHLAMAIAKRYLENKERERESAKVQ